MKVSWVVCFFAIRNVVNVPFSFFFFRDASWTWISAWAMKVSWGGVFLPLGTSLKFFFFFFFLCLLSESEFLFGLCRFFCFCFFLPLGTWLRLFFLFFFYG